MSSKIAIVALVLLNFSCNFQEKFTQQNSVNTDYLSAQSKESKEQTAQLTRQYFRDSILKEHSGVIDRYFSLYVYDTCKFLKNVQELKIAFHGINIIKGIRTSKANDTVFVMPILTLCDIGQSYYFFDNSLPRLLTDSECCDPANFFVCEDITEDGINEIGIYYSSCVGRNKSLQLYSLQQDYWKEIGSSTFDVMTKDPSTVKFQELVKKISKNKFQICNFEYGATNWETITVTDE